MAPPLAPPSHRRVGLQATMPARYFSVTSGNSISSHLFASVSDRRQAARQEPGEREDDRANPVSMISPRIDAHGVARLGEAAFGAFTNSALRDNQRHSTSRICCRASNRRPKLLSEQTHDARAHTFFGMLRASLPIVFDEQFQLTVPLTTHDINRRATG